MERMGRTKLRTRRAAKQPQRVQKTRPRREDKAWEAWAARPSMYRGVSAGKGTGAIAVQADCGAEAGQALLSQRRSREGEPEAPAKQREQEAEPGRRMTRCDEAAAAVAGLADDEAASAVLGLAEAGDWHTNVSKQQEDESIENIAAEIRR